MHIVTVEKDITFSMNPKQMKVSVLMSSSPRQSIFKVDLLHCCTFLLAPRCVSCGPSARTELRQQM